MPPDVFLPVCATAVGAGCDRGGQKWIGRLLRSVRSEARTFPTVSASARPSRATTPSPLSAPGHAAGHGGAVATWWREPWARWPLDPAARAAASGHGLWHVARRAARSPAIADVTREAAVEWLLSHGPQEDGDGQRQDEDMDVREGGIIEEEEEADVEGSMHESSGGGGGRRGCCCSAGRELLGDAARAGGRRGRCGGGVGARSWTSGRGKRRAQCGLIRRSSRAKGPLSLGQPGQEELGGAEGAGPQRPGRGVRRRGLGLGRALPGREGRGGRRAAPGPLPAHLPRSRLRSCEQGTREGFADGRRDGVPHAGAVAC